MPVSANTAAATSAAAAVSRIALGIEYSGAGYYGFQRQRAELPTIQAELELALTKVAGGQQIEVSCAGRTDADVHACEQVVHFSAPVFRSEFAWVMGTNSHLPKDISVLWATQVSPEFDARFCARRRRYRYVIYQHPVRPALLGRQLTWTYKELAADKMHQAAQYLLGTHDFSSFRAAECQVKSPIKTLDGIAVTRFGSYIVLDIRASAFLHHMVRNIAGSLMAIGAGDKPVQWLAEVLAAKDRTKAGVTAAPYGLYLVQVEYDAGYALPQVALGPSFLSAMPDVLAEC